MTTHTTPTGDDTAPAVLADQDVVDDYTLRRQRLTGSLARGRTWRVRPERSALKYLLLGALLTAVALLLVGVVAFVRGQLADRAATPRPAAHSAAATAPGDATAQLNRS